MSASQYEPVSPVLVHEQPQYDDVVIDAASAREQSRMHARRNLTTMSNISTGSAAPTYKDSWKSIFRKQPPAHVGLSDLPMVEEAKKVTQIADRESTERSEDEIRDLETHWPLISDEKMRKLGQNFHPGAQLNHLLLHGLGRWLLTAGLITAMVVVIWKYSTYPVMSERDKNTYNFITIGLSLALGMALASALKGMAVNLRWWLLSLRHRSPREVDLILHCDSLTECIKLGFVAPRFIFGCALWLLLNIGFQVAVAAIGLTYSADARTNFASLVTGVDGSGNNITVNVANLTEIFTESFVKGGHQTEGDKEYTANSYGNIALSYQTADVAKLPPPQTIWSSSDRSDTLFYGPNFWQFNFFDQSPEFTEEDKTYLSIYTTRNINTTWDCFSWAVTDGGDGQSENITLLINSSGVRRNVSVPFLGGVDQTTFFTDPSTNLCGPGCSTVSAFEASVTKPYFYRCNVTVSTVGNGTLPEHEISNELRTMAAGAIALQGYYIVREDESDQRQYQSYPSASIFGFPVSGNTNSMGSTMARFALGAIAANSLYGQSISVIGAQPTKGSALQVKWDQLIAILAVVAGLQFVLFLVSSFVANRVVVKDDSQLAIARTLRPLVERLGPAGSMADGKQIAEALDDEGAPMNVVYSVRHANIDDLHHLDLGVQKRLRAFPRGDYD